MGALSVQAESHTLRFLSKRNLTIPLSMSARRNRFVTGFQIERFCHFLPAARESDGNPAPRKLRM
jgi:hypothetical protein